MSLDFNTCICIRRTMHMIGNEYMPAGTYFAKCTKPQYIAAAVQRAVKRATKWGVVLERDDLCVRYRVSYDKASGKCEYRYEDLDGRPITLED